MVAENPLALSFILPADVYMLNSEKTLLSAAIAPIDYQEQAVEEVPMVNEPVVMPAAPVISEPIAVKEVPAIPQIPSSAIKTAETVEFTYKGNYQQKFLVIVNYPGHELMEATHLNALENTIKRKEMSLGDVAIFNIGKYPGTDIKTIGRFFKPKRMLLLGKDSFPAGLNEPVFNQLTMLGTCQLLYSYNFTDMMSNRELVKAFWEQMKML